MEGQVHHTISRRLVWATKIGVLVHLVSDSYMHMHAIGILESYAPATLRYSSPLSFLGIPFPFLFDNAKPRFTIDGSQDWLPDYGRPI